MKLASAMVERTLDQLEAEALPDNHPAVPKLNEFFGDHTFFIGEDGLHIVEPTEPGEAGDATGNVVRVARWNDGTRTSLMPQAPEPTDIVINLGSDGVAA